MEFDPNLSTREKKKIEQYQRLFDKLENIHPSNKKKSKIQPNPELITLEQENVNINDQNNNQIQFTKVY